MIGGFFNTALAMLSLCFCPPESLFPESPILLSIVFGNSLTNSHALAILRASTIS
jgi:hypothetical protein